MSAFDYKLGKAYMLHVAHPKGTFLIVGSAGFIPGQLEGMAVDAIFLGAGGIGSQTADYREQYWAETVGHTRPERIFLIHWDSLTGPLDGPLTGEGRIAGFLDDARKSDKFKQLIIVAAPSLLGNLRSGLNDQTRKLVSLELDKNLSQLTPVEIRKHMPEYLPNK